MNDTSWYAEASLTSDMHVYCSGSLAQCVRRWSRLTEAQQSAASIKLGGRTDAGETLSHDALLALSKKPELHKV
jgi:hypothetical protein